MAGTKSAAGRRVRDGGRGGVPENAIAQIDSGLHGQALVAPDVLAERLRKALEAADGSVQRASALGKYQLSQIQLACSLKAGFVILEMGGALTLTWTIPKP